MVISCARSQLNHFQRSAQVYVQTALLGFAVQRGGGMNNRISRMYQASIVVVSETKARIRQVAQKQMDPRIQVPFELHEFQMQLQGPPESLARPLLCARPHQKGPGCGLRRKK